MKKHFYLFAVMMLASTLFMAAPAKAATVSTNTSSSNNQNIITDILDLLGLGGSSSTSSSSNSTSCNTTSTKLPINSNIAFLMVAGMLIGVTAVSKNKFKAAELQA